MCRRTLSHLRPSRLPVSNIPYLQERDNMSQDSVMGIDVGGQFLDLHVLPHNQAARLPNDPQGIRETLQLAKDRNVSLIVMEATGGIEMPRALACGLEAVTHCRYEPLAGQGLRSLLTGRLAKTDAIDAQGGGPLHFHPQIRRPPPPRPPSCPSQGPPRSQKAAHRPENPRVPSPQARPRPSAPKPPQTHPVPLSRTGGPRPPDRRPH